MKNKRFAVKVLFLLLAQNENNLITKIKFVLCFFIYYFAKYIFKKEFILFPSMKFRFFGTSLFTRPYTVDFWMASLEFEKSIIEKLIKLWKRCKKAVFIDVGAHIGRYTLLLSKLGWEIFSFEPLFYNYSWLVFNIKNNKEKLRGKVQAFKLACGSREEKRIIYFSFSKPAEASLKRKRKLRECIEVVSLDNFLFKKLDKKLVVIKIDVEGNEVEVLNGAKKTIEKYKPVIILEISPENRERIKHLMKRFGYISFGCFWIPKSLEMKYKEIFA